MPVHAITKEGRVVGYQWGASGKVFRQRRKAEAQGRAILSTGWREDRAARAIVRKLAQKLSAHGPAERTFARAAMAILDGVHRGVLGMLEREVLPAAVVRHDANDESVADRARRILTPRLTAKIAGHVRKKAAPAYDAMAGAVDKKNKNATTSLLGIPIREIAVNAGGTIEQHREECLRYLMDAGRDYADDVREILTDPANEGLRAEELAKQIDARGGVTARHAKLIATDQTLKLNASLTRARYRSAGISKYRWSTSRDERVRPSHVEMEGEECDYEDPPIVDDEPTNPGFAINCRCVAVPLLDDEQDGDVEDDEEPEAQAAE